MRCQWFFEKLECGYRLDLLVESRVVVELKAVTKLDPVHFAQMMT
ncbi:MAG: GxxExxY protein [Longimicrobiales bacterium]